MTADSHYIISGKCACGCNQEVPSGKFWATPECGRRGNVAGKRMPVRLEYKGRSAYKAKANRQKRNRK